MSHSGPFDTISAIATAPGEGAIAIVRVSGPETYVLANKFFRCSPPLPSARNPGTFVHGQIFDSDAGEVIDDALLLFFRAPHSYTGEDSVEIQCHGGSQAAKRILALFQGAGARQAEPGEFTKRAFLNDKFDLTQAEAVLDLIHARSERAARLATAQLEDVLGRRIRALYDALLVTAADIEAMLDFPDDELPQYVPNEISNRLNTISTEIKVLLGTWHEGQILREGVRIVIVGAPNVGKSTLLNLLAGRDRAIVSPYPGTTRDTIEEFITLQGYPMQLMDTAGLRHAPCEIEQEGIRRTHQALAKADLCLCLVDASAPLSAEETNFLATQKPQRTLVFLNKIDQGQVLFSKDVFGLDSLSISLRNKAALAPIIETIVQKVVQKNSGCEHEVLAISERHKVSLLDALDDVSESINRISSGLDSDFLLAATHARSALDSIGHIFGKNCTEEMLNTIFSRFCVGK